MDAKIWLLWVCSGSITQTSSLVPPDIPDHPPQLSAHRWSSAALLSEPHSKVDFLLLQSLWTHGCFTIYVIIHWSSADEGGGGPRRRQTSDRHHSFSHDPVYRPLRLCSSSHCPVSFRTLRFCDPALQSLMGNDLSFSSIPVLH